MVYKQGNNRSYLVDMYTEMSKSVENVKDFRNIKVLHVDKKQQLKMETKIDWVSNQIWNMNVLPTCIPVFAKWADHWIFEIGVHGQNWMVSLGQTFESPD